MTDRRRLPGFEIDPDPEIDRRRDPAEKRLARWLVTPPADALSRIAEIRARLLKETPAPRHCAVNGCHQPATEEHHWAPRAIFGAVAEAYPTAWLCQYHHQLWHDTIAVYHRQSVAP